MEAEIYLDTVRHSGTEQGPLPGTQTTEPTLVADTEVATAESAVCFPLACLISPVSASRFCSLSHTLFQASWGSVLWLTLAVLPFQAAGQASLHS